MSMYTKQDIEIAREAGDIKAIAFGCAGLFIGGGLAGLIFYGILNWSGW